MAMVIHIYFCPLVLFCFLAALCMRVMASIRLDVCQRHLATTNRAQTFRRMAAAKIGISATLLAVRRRLFCPLLPKMHTGNTG